MAPNPTRVMKTRNKVYIYNCRIIPAQDGVPRRIRIRIYTYDYGDHEWLAILSWGILYSANQHWYCSSFPTSIRSCVYVAGRERGFGIDKTFPRRGACAWHGPSLASWNAGALKCELLQEPYGGRDGTNGCHQWHCAGVLGPLFWRATTTTVDDGTMSANRDRKSPRGNEGPPVADDGGSAIVWIMVDTRKLAIAEAHQKGSGREAQPRSSETRPRGAGVYSRF